MTVKSKGLKGKPKGNIQFLENHWPSLPAGDYTIAVKQTVGATVPPRTIPETSFLAAEREFSVLGPRFSLDPVMIRAVFPPPGSLGEHSSVLPHITFSRSTLPWERQPLQLSENEDEALAHKARVELFEELLSKENGDSLKGLQKKAREVLKAGARKAKKNLDESIKRIIDDDPKNKESIQMKDLWQKLHDKKQTPWLALLLFDQDEIDEKEGVDTKPALIRTCSIAEDGDQFVLHPTVGGVKSPSFDREYGQEADDPVMALEVKRELLGKILPSLEATRWLAHARHATDEDDQPISEELATLLCNRLPRPDRTSIVHLVSLEGRYEERNLWETAAVPGNERIRLVSLKSWRFSCVSEEHSFKGLLHNLDYGGRRNLSGAVQVSGSVQPDAAAYRIPGSFDTGKTPTTLCIPDEGHEKSGPYLRSGYVALPHQMRDGNRSVSWFHSALAPGEAVNTSADSDQLQLPKDTLPARSADQLVRYFPHCGMFDVSYSAAWELGRLLTLANRSVAIDLLDWKRRHRHRQEQETARRELTHLPVEGQTADTTLPSKVADWFQNLSLLKGVPFNYLVPDERMLPQESLRFFWIDAAWISCLLDGAFSVGRALPSDFDRDKNHESKPDVPAHATVTGFLLRSQVVSGWPDLLVDGYGERVDDDDYERSEKIVAPPIRPSITLATMTEANDLARKLDAGDVAEAREKFGFPAGKELLLGPYEPDASLSNKSQTRPAAWMANLNENEEIYLIRRHENQFTVKLENKLHLLRMARMSQNVLLCLFAGEVKTVDIHQKPEALHFGVNPRGGKQPNYYRRLKSRTAAESREEVKIHWKPEEKDPEMRVIDVTRLVADMKNSEECQSFGEFTAAQFALQMVEGVQKVRFRQQQP